VRCLSHAAVVLLVLPGVVLGARCFFFLILVKLRLLLFGRVVGIFSSVLPVYGGPLVYGMAAGLLSRANNDDRVLSETLPVCT
jgi:prolipoprotein diacylglyceryltransferase